MKLEDVKELIKKLQKVTVENAASENEAKIAAKKIQNLLIKHHLELNDISEEEANSRIAVTKEIFSTGRLMWYDEKLLVVLKDHYFVSIFKKGKSIEGVGFEEDIEVVKYVFNFLRNIMKSTFKNKSKKDKTINRNDYYNGFIDGIDKYLTENEKSKKEEFSTALVVVSDAIEKAMAGIKVKSRNKSGIKPKFDNNVNAYSEGFIEGKKAGNELNSNKKSIE